MPYTLRLTRLLLVTPLHPSLGGSALASLATLRCRLGEWLLHHANAEDAVGVSKTKGPGAGAGAGAGGRGKEG